MKLVSLTKLLVSATILATSSSTIYAGLPQNDFSDVEKKLSAPPKKQKKDTKKSGYSKKQKKTENSHYFNIPKTRFYMNGQGGFDYLSVDALNTSWTITTYPADWVDVSDRSSESLKISCGENPSATERSTYMIITAGDTQYPIYISQSGSIPFQVTDVKLANTDVNGNEVYSGLDEPLYTYELKYLRPRVYYNGGEKKKDRLAQARIIFPDGSIDEVESPSDYTYTDVLHAEPGTGNYQDLYTWGSESESVPYYLPGNYVYKLYIDDELAFTKPFQVRLRPTDHGAQITSIDITDNVVQDGKEGMVVNLGVQTQNLEGYKIATSVYLYDSNGSKQLRDARGSVLFAQDQEVVPSDDYYWTEWPIFIPYDMIRSAQNGGNTFSFKIQIQNTETQKLLAKVATMQHKIP